jgi:hypothetical protein
VDLGFKANLGYILRLWLKEGRKEERKKDGRKVTFNKTPKGYYNFLLSDIPYF